MSQKLFCQFAVLFSLGMGLLACANQPPLTKPDVPEAHDTTATTPEAKKTIVEEDQQLLNEPPLFTYITPKLDPVMWTNEPMSSPTASLGIPQIVGRLPGQRELPNNLFEEAAEPYSLAKPGAVIFVQSDRENNLWQRVRNGFALPHQINPRIQNHIDWYIKHPTHIKRVAIRAEKYLHLIVEETERMGMPLEIALLPIVESAFQPFAYSHSHAAGLWQFIPGTGKIYGLKQNWWYDGRRDVKASTIAALQYLKYLHRILNNDWLLALAAYNSGSGTVRKAIRKNKRKNKPTDFWSLALPRETRSYVPKLIAISEIISDPKKYNVQLHTIKNQPYMAEIDTKSQIDLALAAQLAEIKMETLYVLNPAFNRWATDPDGPHKLMVPVEKAEVFKTNLSALEKSKRMSWKRHKIKKGESLLSIACKYRTTVTLIRELNQIQGDMIRAGKNLIVPASSNNEKTYSFKARQRLLAKQNTKKSRTGKITYRVKSGDSLWSISRKYNVGYLSLAKWNRLAPNDTLRPGKKLVVWTKKAPAPSAKFSPHSSKMMTKKISYRVRPGDSLARISQKFNVNILDLKRWNRRISQQKYLQPGQRLTVHVNITNQTS